MPFASYGCQGTRHQPTLFVSKANQSRTEAAGEENVAHLMERGSSIGQASLSALEVIVHDMCCRYMRLAVSLVLVETGMVVSEITSKSRLYCRYNQYRQQ